jgi:hypothetical protein
MTDKTVEQAQLGLMQLTFGAMATQVLGLALRLDLAATIGGAIR